MSLIFIFYVNTKRQLSTLAICAASMYSSSRSCVRGLHDAVGRRSTASTETRSTAVASTSASTARRSWPTVRPAWCGHGSPATATGLSVPTATFHSCRGDSAANSASKLRPYGDIQIYLLLLLLLLFWPRYSIPREWKNYAIQYKKVQKNQAGMNLTLPPSQNSHAVRWHCTAESERRVAEIKSWLLFLL